MAFSLGEVFVDILPQVSNAAIKDALQDATRSAERSMKPVSISGKADTKGLERDFSAAGDKAGKAFGGKVGGSIKSLIGVAGAAFAGAQVGSLFKGFVSDAREAEKLTRVTGNVITTMGNQANISASQVESLSSALAVKTGIDDAAIQSGQNLLLTFGNVRNEVGKGNDIFTQATKLGLDMSVALGTDASGAALQLGKALNDPVKGITALSRAGVSFTEQQKEQIKALVASGDTLGAQKIILGELEKQFGGTAAAAADPMDRLRNAAGELGESVGSLLLPKITQFAEYATTTLVPAVEGFIQGLQDTDGTFQTRVIPTITAARDLLSDVVGFVDRNSEAFKALAAVLGGAAAAYAVISGVTKAYAVVQGVLNAVLAANPIGIVVIAIAALAAGLIYAYKNSETFRDVFRTVFQAVSKVVLGVIDGILGAMQKVFEVMGKVPLIGDKFKAAADAIGGARDQVSDLGNKIANLKDKAITVAVNYKSMGAVRTVGVGGGVQVASGGHISGPGGPTEDKIPAWLSNGEFVQRASAVKKYGVKFMEDVNAGRFSLGGMIRRFAGGGRVKVTIPDKQTPGAILANINGAANAMGTAFQNAAARTGEGVGGGGGRATSGSGALVAFGRMLQGMGVRVGEHPAFGGVAPVHKGRGHYEGRAIDINTRGGTSALEQRELAPLVAQAKARGFSTIFMSAGHFGHAHIESRAKGGLMGSITNPHIRDTGGPLLPGFTYNGTGKSEMVIPHFAAGGMVRAEDGSSVRPSFYGATELIALQNIIGNGANLAAIQKFRDAWAETAAQAAAYKAELLAVGKILDAKAALAQAKTIEDRAAAQETLNDATKSYTDLKADEQYRREQVAAGALVGAVNALADAARNAADAAKTALSSLNSLLDAQQSVSDRRVDSVKTRDDALKNLAENRLKEVAEFNQREGQLQSDMFAGMGQAARDYAREQSKIIADRTRSLLIGVKDSFSQGGFANSLSSITGNLGSQARDLTSYSASLSDALGRGFDSSMLEALGIDGPEDLAQLREFLKATDAEIADARKALAARATAAQAQTKLEQQRGLGDIGRALVAASQQYNEAVASVNAGFSASMGSLNSERLVATEENAKAVEDIWEKFREEQKALDTEWANIGKDQGRSMGEAIAEGLRSAIPAILAAAQATQEASRLATQRAVEATAPPRGTAGYATVNGTRYHVNTAGIIDQPGPFYGRYPAQVQVYDQGGWLQPGGIGVNKTGKPEAVLDPRQSQWLKKAADANAESQRDPEWAMMMVREMQGLRAEYRRMLVDMKSAKRKGAV